MTEAVAESKSVFKNKNYVLLFLGALVSNLGTTIYNFAIDLYILKITDSNAIIAGLYLAAGGFVYFIVTPFGGAIVDRLDRVKVVYITDFIRGSAILVAGYLLYTGVAVNTQIIILFVITVILSVNGGLFGPATSALPANILEPNQLQQANSLNQGANSLYNIVGLLGGAFLYWKLGINLIFIINGISFILSGISEMFITTKTKADPNHIVTFKGTVEDIKIGFKYMIKLKPIFYVILVALFLNFFWAPPMANGMPYLFQSMLKDEAANIPSFYSYVLASFSVGVIVASIIIGSMKQKESIFGLLRFGLIGMSVMFILFAANIHMHVLHYTSFALFIVLSIAIGLIMGAFNGAVNIPFGTAVQVRVEKEMQGRVFSVLSVIAMGLTPLAVGLGGVVIQFLGVVPLFYISAIMVTLLSLYASSNKYIKQL